MLRMNKKEVETVVGMNMNASFHKIPFLNSQHWFDLAKTAAQKIILKSDIINLLNELLLTNSSLDGWLDKSLCWVNQRNTREMIFSRNKKNAPDLEFEKLCTIKSYLKDTLNGRRPNEQSTLGERKTMENRFRSRLSLPGREPKNIYINSSINKRAKRIQQTEALTQYQLSLNARQLQNDSSFEQFCNSLEPLPYIGFDSDFNQNQKINIKI